MRESIQTYVCAITYVEETQATLDRPRKIQRFNDIFRTSYCITIWCFLELVRAQNEVPKSQFFTRTNSSTDTTAIPTFHLPNSLVGY